MIDTAHAPFERRIESRNEGASRTRANRQLRRLLIFFTSADHPQRDAACATLAWLAACEGTLFECYFDSRHTGVHFGGGHPRWFDPADLRGTTVAGGRHIEAFHLLLQHFDCEAACLGPTLFDDAISSAGIRVRARSNSLTAFYKELIDTGGVAWPETALVVGDGGRPQGVPLRPYAYPEIVNRRLLAVGDTDPIPSTIAELVPSVEGLWLPPQRLTAWRNAGVDLTEINSPSGGEVAEQTAWMASRWKGEGAHEYFFGDPELVGRWTPSAVRYGWLPLYGIPQARVIELMSDDIAKTSLAHGRQHHDQDFFKLSKLGVGFQCVDPGSPPFPVIREIQERIPTPEADPEDPTDEQLHRWASERRVLSTLLFWTGMIRELQNLYPLADLLSITGLRAGVILTTESFNYMAGSPLALIYLARDKGGLYPRIESLLTDTGSGVLVAADAPRQKFAETLRASRQELASRFGSDSLVPKGWWAHLDAPITPGRRTPRVSWFPHSPRLRIRYTPRNRLLIDPDAADDTVRDRVRTRIRGAQLARRYFEPLRPYETWRPGSPSRSVLQSVRDAGFEYAVTKASYGAASKAVTDVDGLTVFNQTAGRWDGWSPFHTVNALGDLKSAERGLLRRHEPGWLVGAIDACLWTFTGSIWKRGSELDEICGWMAAGGSSGEIVNVTPRTVARYARLLASTGSVGRIQST